MSFQRYVVFLVLAILSGLLSSCARPEQLGLSPQQWNTLSKTQQKTLTTNYYKIKYSGRRHPIVYKGPGIEVKLSQGMAMMPPFTHAYPLKSTTFQINPGHCQSVILSSAEANRHVKLSVCYNGLSLSLDPSRYNPEKKTGTLHFDYNPIWKRGFTYKNVSSLGYARLKNVNVMIRTVSNKDPNKDEDMAPVEDVHDTRS